MNTARAFLRFAPNLMLAAASGACFWIFLQNATSYTGDLASQDSIGSLAQGEADRKRAGSISFAPAHPGALLYFRDMIWVGPGSQADLAFSDGTRLRLLENTFIVLMRRPGASQESAIVQVLKGEIKVQAKGRNVVIETQEDDASKTDEQAAPKIKPSPPSPPSPSPVPPTAKSTLIYPVDRSLLYIVEAEDIQLSLAWPEGARGTLVLTEKGGTEILRQEVGAMNSVLVRLKVEKTYEWKIQGPRGVVVGPTSFEVKRFTTEALEKQLDPTSDRVIEIIGDKKNGT